MPHIKTWSKEEMLCVKSLNTLAREVCNLGKILVFSAFKVDFCSVLRLGYLDRALAALFALP